MHHSDTRRVVLPGPVKKSVTRIGSLVFMLTFPINPHCIGLLPYPFHQRQVH